MGNIVAPFTTASVNVHDTRLFDESFTNLLELADELNWDLSCMPITLDSGFDSKINRIDIRNGRMVPVIKPNLRGLKDEKKKHQKFTDFDLVEYIYNERYKIERCFAWEDKYRKLVVRYEKLQCTFNGFRYLAYSMINFRWLFGKP